ncbi:MAG TPA: hypothetical protein VHD62_18245 [Opitutaceae bacterium]|nr:hypothetical protein [Opitutaceae bacterium]
MKRLGIALWFFALGLIARGSAAPVLESAVERWLGERDHWAFTQRAVEYEDGKPHERVERYDPSLPGNQRWRLISIDGKAPTPEQRAAWEKRKFKKRPHRFDAPLGDYFDFEHAKLLGEDDTAARYDVPLRNDRNWLFPTDKVDVRVTVNKQTRALEHLTAHVREPFKVLLGIARVTGGDIDLDFLGLDETPPASPAEAQPTGTARVSAYRMGERVDFTWSDFKRVTPVATADDGAKPPPM